MSYQSADGTQRCERRGCTRTFMLTRYVPKHGPTRKRFCSATCRHMEAQYRKGVHKRKVFGECRNGHQRTPTNTVLTTRGGYTFKECLECRAARELDPKRMAYKQDWEARNRERRIARKRMLRLRVAA